MLNHIRPAVVSAVALTLLLGVAYPLAMTAVSQGIAPDAANGSLVRVGGQDGGRVVGSRLIGQVFTRPEYLQGRPSAAGDGYDPTQSGGSNLGPMDPRLADRVKKSVASLGGNPRAIPADAVTASASGLDPDISPEFARLQAPRIAAARHVGLDAVTAVINGKVEGRLAGLIGEPRVNVLAVNVALDQRFGNSRSNR